MDEQQRSLLDKYFGLNTSAILSLAIAAGGVLWLGYVAGGLFNEFRAIEQHAAEAVQLARSCTPTAKCDALHKGIDDTERLLSVLEVKLNLLLERVRELEKNNSRNP